MVNLLEYFFNPLQEIFYGLFRERVSGRYLDLDVMRAIWLRKFNVKTQTIRRGDQIILNRDEVLIVEFVDHSDK